MKKYLAAATSLGKPIRIVCIACLSFCVLAAHAQRRKRIAVLSFETGADAQQSVRSLGSRDDLGLALSNLLVNQIAVAGKVQIVERSALDRVLREQNLSNTDRMDDTTAARIGKIVGVDAILIGSVSQFTASSKETSGSKLASMTGKSQVHRMQTRVAIVVTSRLVDVNTGVVLTTAKGQGSAENVEMQVTTGANNQQMGNPVLNEAVTKAIDTMATQLDAAPVMSEMVAVARVAFKATVADADGSTLVLALPANSGARIGDVVQLSRVGRTVRGKDGSILKVISEPLGTAKIIEVDEKSATVTYTGSKPAKADDIASYTP